MEMLQIEDNWELLLKFLPKNWEQMVYDTKALVRKRVIDSPKTLLRVLLMYLSDNCSLVTTVTKAKMLNIANISDVTLLNRLRSSADLFQMLSNELLKYRGVNICTPDIFNKYRIISVDSSVISEPGSTGTDWRLHYSLDLMSVKCKEFKVTRQNVGESFVNYEIEKNDLYIGDRAYGRYKGIKHVLNKGGDFVVRYMNKAFTIYDIESCKIDLNEKIKNLKIGEILDFDAFINVGKEDKIPVRFCVLKKSKVDGEKSIKKAKQSALKKQKTISEATLELHKYIIILTSLPKTITTNQILELYRLRWQIEIAFKRLKSIFGLGHLPKKDILSGKAWLNGKIFLAILTQTIADESYHFSPWGYPIKSN